MRFRAVGDMEKAGLGQIKLLSSQTQMHETPNPIYPYICPCI